MWSSGAVPICRKVQTQEVQPLRRAKASAGGPLEIHSGRMIDIRYPGCTSYSPCVANKMVGHRFVHTSFSTVSCRVRQGERYRIRVGKVAGMAFCISLSIGAFRTRIPSQSYEKHEPGGSDYLCRGLALTAGGLLVQEIL